MPSVYNELYCTQREWDSNDIGWVALQQRCLRRAVRQITKANTAYPYRSARIYQHSVVPKCKDSWD